MSLPHLSQSLPLTPSLEEGNTLRVWAVMLAVNHLTPTRSHVEGKLILLSKGRKGQVLLLITGQGRKCGICFSSVAVAKGQGMEGPWAELKLSRFEGLSLKVTVCLHSWRASGRCIGRCLNEYFPKPIKYDYSNSTKISKEACLKGQREGNFLLTRDPLVQNIPEVWQQQEGGACKTEALRAAYLVQQCEQRSCLI